MNRRTFLAASAVGLLPGWPRLIAGIDPDLRINRVTSFELESRRPKHVGKNAYRHDHGTLAFDRVVRLRTNSGMEGLGPCWAGANECVSLLGRSPLDFFDRTDRRVTGALGRYTSPLWDLVGRLLNQPVHRLLGGQGPGPVKVYDGSIYFTDLRPEHLDDWPEAFRRELDASLAMGHRAFKVKIGRGKLWRLAEEGFERDLDVVRLIRRHIGPQAVLAVDANDAYDLERTKRFIRETADLRLAFVEEMFPDEVAGYLEVKALIAELGLPTLIADGENKRVPEDMRAWADAGAVDIYQGDMNLFGFEDIMREAEVVRPAGGMVAPHNWGSLLGYYLQLQVGRALPNFYMAEQDPMSCPAMLAEGFELREGVVDVSDAPGLGLRLDEAALARTACVHFDLKA